MPVQDLGSVVSNVGGPWAAVVGGMLAGMDLDPETVEGWIEKVRPILEAAEEYPLIDDSHVLHELVLVSPGDSSVESVGEFGLG